MNNMMLGRYVPGHSLIHRMDPRAKLILVFVYVGIVFLANNGPAYAVLTAFALVLLLLSQVPLLFVVKGLKPVLWIMLFTFLMHVLMTKEGNVLYQMGELAIYEGGVQKGIFISLRFLLFILISTLLTLTTTPIQVTDAIESLFGPLKRFRVPVHELALMMSISLRFIPTLMEETEKMMKAQMARGVDFHGGAIKERMKAIVSLLVPLFVHSFKRAEELAIAMEARGYRGGDGRTKYRVLTWKWADTCLISSVLILAVILFLLRS